MATVNCFLCFGEDQDPIRDGISSSLQTKVGDLFSLLWDLSVGAVTNLFLLYRNAQRLDDEMTQLEQLRDDLHCRANAEAAQPQTEIISQVRGWIRRVEKLHSEVTQFQAALDRQSIYITGLCLGYTAVDSLRRAQELARQGRSFSNVTSPAAPGADTLAVEMDELVAVRDDLVRRIEAQEAADPQVRRTHLVDSWVKKMDALVCSAASSETTAAASGVIDKLKQVNYLKAQAKNLQGRDVVSLLPPAAVEELPSVPSSSIIGGEEALSEVRGYLREEEGGIIGIYGMGGVGKTTLLRKLNNELLQGEGRSLFNVVAWVTVSKETNILAIQYDIGKRMGLPFSPDDSSGAGITRRPGDDRAAPFFFFSDAGSSGTTRRQGDQAVSLFKALSRKRFLIFFDDVWEKLDLEKIGIPHPGDRKNCKIAFTTRSFEVCIDMDADKTVEVKPLDETRSWALFCRKVGRNEALSDPSIRALAEEVVKRCGGLPLFLITAARAMAGRENRNEWNHAITALDELATELRGMEPVLSTLKFSYDRLENDTMRRCLLHCAGQFPEDALIPRERVVESWVRGGLLSDEDGSGRYGNVVDVDRARNKGHVIVGRLQDACLLEAREMEEHGGEAVGVHDAIRDMASWLLASEHDGSGKANNNDAPLAMAGTSRTEVVSSDLIEEKD